MDELAGQTTALFNLSETTTQVFDRWLAFNLLPASLDERPSSAARMWPACWAMPPRPWR